MGLFDTVKLKANALAADAERAGKVTAAQARTVVLQNDIRKAERELGHSAFTLIEGGHIAHPDLEAAATRLRDARRTLPCHGAAPRSRLPCPPVPASETSGPPPEIVEEAAALAMEPAAAEEPVKAAAETAKKPAAKRRAPAAKKPAPKKAVATKKTPKKPAAEKKPAVVKAPPAGDS
jgi:outer membrane biosynthesis protein TonB